MKKTSMTYLAAIAVFLSSALCAVHAAPSDDIGAVRRLEAEYVAQGGSERLEAWRKGLDDYNNAYGRTLDAALLKARFHYFGEGNACAAIDSLKPYMHYAPSRPEIPYFIWMMCGDIPHGGSAALQPLLNDSAFEHKGIITTLRSYWASFIPDDFKTDARDAAEIVQCKGGCTRTEGLRAWREFLDILEQAEIARQVREERAAEEKRLKASGVMAAPPRPTPAPKTSGKGFGIRIVP